MAHTDFSTLDHVAQYEDTDGLTLVLDLDATSPRLADALGILDVIALDVLDGIRDLIAQGNTVDDLNNENNEWAWVADLADVEVSA
jgi:hypothetical protein